MRGANRDQLEIGRTGLQSNIILYGEVRGWFIVKTVFASRRGGMDVYGVRHGRHVWIEVKREGEEARRQQEYVANLMRGHGAEVFCVDNLEDAMRILK